MRHRSQERYLFLSIIKHTLFAKLIRKFIGNAVVRIDTATGKTTIVAKNAPNAGANGKLVSPSECIRLNNTIYVSNINLTYGPHTAIPEQTMSAIDVE